MQQPRMQQPRMQEPRMQQPRMQEQINNKDTQQTIIPKYTRASVFLSICSICCKDNLIDARCCGLCYYFCPSKKKPEDRCECCPNTFIDYWYSGYIQTDSGYGNNEKNSICCWLCFPIKFPVFFPCFIGSLCNNCINWLRDTELNYLF